MTNGFRDGLQEKGFRDAYWFARLTSTSPVPIGPTLIGSGLEGLINAWLASPEGRSSGTRLNRADWQLIRDSIEPILLDKLKPYGDPRRFIEGFQNLNRLAVSEQAERFFGGIGLAIGEVERHAMKIRNPLAHGALFRRGFVHELYMATSAYRTLFNRTVLMLLRWNESYIDYSTYKYPSRSLGSPLGGPNGDGRPVLIPRG